MMRVLVLIFLAIPAQVSLASPTCPELTDLQREEIRFNLERLYYGSELLIRNRAADANDYQRLQRQAEYLRLFERIPFKTDQKKLRKELEESATAAGLRLKGLRVFREKTSQLAQAKKAIPETIDADEIRFHLSDAQLTDGLLVEIQVDGDKEKVEAWTRSWSTKLVRWLEPVRVERLGKKASHWRIRAKAYEFRKILFPRIVPRDPETLLPKCGKTEPRFLKLVKKIKEVVPKAAQEYEKRREHLLLEQRLSFFVAKSVQSPVK